MLANPAANIAQHGSMNCPLAGHGAVSARTSARNALRSLCPSTQLRIVLSSLIVLFMDVFSPYLLVLQQVHENTPQLCGVVGVLFPDSIPMCQACSFLSEFCCKHFLSQCLTAYARNDCGRCQKRRRARSSLACGILE